MIIWIIGYLFTVGFIFKKDSKESWLRLFVMLLCWPFELGAFISAQLKWGEQ